MNLAEIHQKRADLTATIAELHRKRGAATLEPGKAKLPGLHDDIARAQIELEALNDAEQEIVRRERAETAEADARTLHRAKAELGERFERWLTAVDAAETCAANLVAAMRDANFASAEIDRLTKLIGGKRSSELHPYEMESKLSNLLSSALLAINGKSSFGVLEFKALPSLRAKQGPEKTWREIEEQRIGGAIATFTGEQK